MCAINPASRAYTHDELSSCQVEPVKWTQQKSRDVLNEAVEGSITDGMLAAAAAAVGDGYEGTLSRSDVP